MDNMATTQFDWGEVNGKVVERLRAPKTVPVPEAIIKQAQRSADGDIPGLRKDSGPLNTLALQHTFKDEAQAAAFVKFMQKAGALVNPPVSMSVVVDPDRKGDALTVSWQARRRRGRKTA